MSSLDTVKVAAAVGQRQTGGKVPESAHCNDSVVTTSLQTAVDSSKDVSQGVGRMREEEGLPVLHQAPTSPQMELACNQQNHCAASGDNDNSDDREILRREAAKLIIFGFDGTSINEHARRMLALGVGGVILFSRNIVDPEQAAGLCAELKRRSSNSRLLIMVDQEGGKSCQLHPQCKFTPLPTAREVGSTKDPQAAVKVATVIGRELRAIHIDVCLGPVVDIDTNPANPIIAERSYGRTPEIVSSMSEAFIRQLQSQGVAGCAKHYPGHGDTPVDSHVELPTVTHGLDRLNGVELAPFRVAVRADVASIMVAHVAFPALSYSCPSLLSREERERDASLPASMSTGALNYLRNQLGYSGLVLSDCLEMGGITRRFSVAEAAVAGLRAGVDMFLVCHTEESQRSAIDAIVGAVNDQSLPLERLREARSRVDALLDQYSVAPWKEHHLEGAGNGTGENFDGADLRIKRSSTMAGMRT
ncbi:hypothetical protein CBR_g20049 [Chara braunii]|uniref:Glycoside hydrolase family 3 N-terminal domain-containing protein n=1 Tax=Chara braunii TaxID=69332 RepID=A0A388KZE2_CHABU|nr:hypothetical protein CBR_g20049 [Chara braunii]|eukprot:GBG75419.1 hypothetical protein CBR_g20049 [Chara braunii]